MSLQQDRDRELLELLAACASPQSLDQIATTIRMGWFSVLPHLNRLTQAGYLIRHDNLRQGALWTTEGARPFE